MLCGVLYLCLLLQLVADNFKHKAQSIHIYDRREKREAVLTYITQKS